MGRHGCGAVCLTLAAAVVLAACGPVRPQPGTGSATPAAPAALQSFAADAVNLVASAGARNWSAVSVELADLEQAWTTLRPAASGRGATVGLLDAVDSAVTALAGRADALSARGTQVAANRVSAFVPDLVVLWPSSVPPQLAEMAYLARAVQLDVQSGRTSPLWMETRTLGTQWAFIRAGARARDPGDAARMDTELPALGSAVSAVLSAGGPAIARPASAAPHPASSSTASSSSTPASSSAGGPITAASSVLAPSASAAAPASSASAAAPRRRSNLSSTSSATSSAQAPRGAAAPPVTRVSTAPVASAAASILQTLGALQRAYGGG